MNINPGIDLALQIWGGVFYLVAKIFLAAAERENGAGKLRLAGWFTYLLGIPAWVILFVSKNNWIFAAVDFSSIPTMILGIVIIYKQDGKVPHVFDVIVKYFTICIIVMGASYSIYFFKGIRTFTQVLEITGTVGFLWGTYLLAKRNPAGWILFAFMCMSTSTLMFLNGKILLTIEQILCLAVIIYGFITAKRKLKKISAAS